MRKKPSLYVKVVLDFTFSVGLVLLGMVAGTLAETANLGPKGNFAAEGWTPWT